MLPDIKERAAPGTGATRNDQHRDQAGEPLSPVMVQHDESSTCGAALQAARRGFHVFPLRPGDKRPAVPDHGEDRCDGTDPRCRNGHTGWEPRATTGQERIRRGWAKTPYNVGVACGPSGLVVVDLDVPKPDESKVLPEEWASIPGVVTGADVFAVIAERAGVTAWPSTYTVFTPSGGMHLYYRAPEGSGYHNTAGRLGPMIDTRGQGGYVVGGGSVTAAGTYEITDDGDAEPLPGWLGELLDPPRPVPGAFRPVAPGAGERVATRLDGLITTVLGAQPGERNNVLHWAASRAAEMIADGQITEDQVHDSLGAAAACAGLDGGEAHRTIASALRQPLRRTP